MPWGKGLYVLVPADYVKLGLVMFLSVLASLLGLHSKLGLSNLSYCSRNSGFYLAYCFPCCHICMYLFFLLLEIT